MMKKGRFDNAPSKWFPQILKINGNIHGSDLVITIVPYDKGNRIDVEITSI
jgi:hypothetical protein